MQLDEIVNWIDGAFGDVSPRPAPSDVEALGKIFGNTGFQCYLRDQVNRQIIRGYLTNAVVLGELTEGGLAAFASQLVSEDGRASLALFMLMSSVEEAKDLPVVSGGDDTLQPLKPVEKARAHITLVRN